MRWLVVLVTGCSFEANLATTPSSDGATNTPGSDASGGEEGGNNACAAAFRSSSSQTAGSGNSVSVATPAGAQVDDVLIATILYQADSDETVGTIDAPLGWTLVRRDSHGGDGAIGQSVYVRVVVVLEPTTHVFTTGPSKRFIGVIHAYDGIDTTSPVALHEGQANTTSASITVPAMTVPACSMIVGSFGTRSISTLTPPAALTERDEVSNNAGASISLEVANGTMAGATGMLAATATQSALNIGQAIALAPE